MIRLNTTPAPMPGASVEHLAPRARAGDPSAIAALATEFESLFVSQVLKEMRQTLEGGLFGEDPSDIRGGLFDMIMSRHLAQAGGFGLAAYLKRHLPAAEGPQVNKVG
jgi:Rod binding domain-containing protein